MPRNAPYGAGATDPAPRTPRLLDQVRQRLRFLHYSIRTERAYADWIKRYILFHHKRHPRELGAAEVESFLTHLAVDRTCRHRHRIRLWRQFYFYTKGCWKQSCLGSTRSCARKGPNGCRPF
ncbi:MAG: phage integrase N-terminal SAM-like domain-containing protein [Pseudomonadota bacterium]|nr:phage integrase N-terminal SAM-like domain-containing protein [Pseudomonadota bacterium]